MAAYAYDDWVGQVRPDPRNTDQLTLVQGYIGQSSENGHIRVYSDESLNNFVEVPEDAIVHAQQLSLSESSLGGSKLWLRSDVVITYGDPKSANRPKTSFLEGDLMQQYTTQYGGYDTTGGMMDAYGGQPAGQGGQFMATAACPITTVQVQCQIQPALTVPAVICKINWNTIIKTKCGPISCFKTLCGPATCIKVLCNPIPGCGGITFNPISLACNPGGPGPVIQPGGGFMGQFDTTTGGYDTTGGMGAYGGQPMEQGGQFMATVAGIQCQAQPFTVQVANCTIIRSVPVANCPILSVPVIRCPVLSVIRTRCSWSSCFRTACGPQTCIPIICGGIPCQFGSITIPTGPVTITETITTGPTGPTGPIIQPGGGFMGQPDTTTMGGYYGTFNPYTTMPY